jgi:hypothetical protein
MWYMNQNTVSPSDSVAQTPGNQATPAVPTTTNTDIAKAPVTTEVTTAPTATERADKEVKAIEVPDNTIASTAHYTPSPSVQEDPSNRTGVNVSNNSTSTNTTDVAVISQPIATIEKNTEVTRPQQNINTTPVTPTQATAYNNKNPEVISDDSGLSSIALEPENNKRGSVKGFLRKATRFIERRTGVATTNENDELLIGAVAIKLK